MDYPGRIIRKGEGDAELVASIYRGLSARGYATTPPLTAYDNKFVSLVKLFQSQNVAPDGQFLKSDGEIGPLTWGAIFGAKVVPVPSTRLANAALGKALSQVGVLEHPIGSNKGDDVEKYLASVGLPGGLFWCMAFVHWCVSEAAGELNVANPLPRTGGVLDSWTRVKKKSPGRIITQAAAIADPTLVKPGFVFIIDHGGGMGHTGFVKKIISGSLATVEGNSNSSGSSNGIGVFELSRRNIANKDIKGFIDIS